MQDGATPHTALSTRRYLKDIFGKKIIGKHFEYAWPPYSPDLTLADYWLWPTLKWVVYSGKQEPYSILEEGNYFRFQESKTTKLNTSWGLHRGKIEEVFRAEKLQIVNFQICTISLNL